MQHPPPSPPAVVEPVRLALDSAVVSDAVRSLCQVTGRARFALSPEVVALSTRVTVSLDGSPDAVWSDGVEALRLAGVDARCAKGGLCRFFPLAPLTAKKEEVPQGVLSYEPVHRDVAFLAGALTGLFQGWHFAGGAPSGAGGAAVSAAVSPASGSGVGAGAGGRAEAAQSVPVKLVGMGPVSDRQHLLAVLRELDRPVSSLVVHLAVYEVDVSRNEQSALTVVGKLLGAAASIGSGVVVKAATGGGAAVDLTIASAGFDAVVSALDTASEAHLVTSPVLRTSSGVLASFAVGDSVPTVGNVSYSAGSSSPVQSIQYQQSGVVFSVVPELVGELVDVALYQSISSFVPTTVGVTSSPTLKNRVLSSDLIVRPGSVVVLGGLMQTSEASGSTGWWIVPKLTSGASKSRTELVLVLSVDVDRR
jgi:type II secretory pathway component GspD/PulD (secretin)